MEIKHVLVSLCHCDKHPRGTAKRGEGFFCVRFRKSVPSGPHLSRLEVRQSIVSVTAYGRGGCPPHSGWEQRARQDGVKGKVLPFKGTSLVACVLHLLSFATVW